MLECWLRYGSCGGVVVEGGGELGWLASNQNHLGIYTEHAGTAGVDNETWRPSGIPLSRDGELGKPNGQDQSDQGRL